MQVTFKCKEGYQSCWEIWVEEEKWREVHRAIFGRKPKISDVSDPKDLQRAFDDLEYRQVKKYVFWRLSQQNYHSEQLKKLLRERFVQKQTSERVLQECQDSGILNDELWLQSFMKREQKRHSLRLILSKLHAKGFSSEALQHIASEWRNPDEELQAIEHLLRTRYRRKDLSQRKDRESVIGALIRKGYSFEQVQKVLSR